MNANRMKLEGNWKQAKGRIRETWGDMTDDELDQVEGNWEQLVGKIQTKTGETVEAIKSKLDDIAKKLSDEQAA
ncbi:MAG TPA: CsbD family protein [Acidimicrobiia bacterium]|nr:CsbD family protein [Acidimicrobiia bacterium]